ncbi:MAG: CBS domain-containing protein [Anaerolineales bacterium]|nr:CBS domain-containing protein [Anaerolineales bacterium]MCX7754128.1 CBS domain-containing protein [Anaerolineales bacterium]MDW8278042.1 CBS domain-containing protein [Anaerolineales bacterium]
MSNLHELQGRRGRIITDKDAREISRVEELSYDLKISEVMTRNVKTVSPDMPMNAVLEILRVNRISGVPVLEHGDLVGILSIEDLVRCMEKNELHFPVSAYMSRNIVSVNAYDSVVKAIETFSTQRKGRLPVVDEAGKLVGIITKGDITRGVLNALQRDYHEEELRRYRASHLFEDITSDRTSLILRYNIKPRDYLNGGQASSHIKRALLRLGANPQLARQCGIAIYEAEMNLIIHTTHGGIIRVQIEPHRILMQTTDDGPGIEDVQKALTPGWSTASQEVRDMGFGAGMGLVNIQRCVDRMELESAPGKGTRLTMEIILRPEERFKETEENGTVA